MKIPSLFRRFPQLLAVVAVILAGLAIAAFLVRTKPEPDRRTNRRQGVLVEVMPLEPQTKRMNVVGTAAAQARNELQLICKVGGEIEYLSPALREGAAFSKGDVLARIDPRRYRLTVERAQAGVRSAQTQLARIEQQRANDEASLELARQQVALYEKELQRAEKLLRTQTGSEAARDTARVQLLTARQSRQALENALALWPAQRDAAQAALEQARTSLDSARLDLEDTEVRAPFDGRTTTLLVEQGQFVAVGSPLARLYAKDAIEATVRVPLEDFLWIDTADLDGTPPRAEARLQVAGQAWAWQGRVVRADAAIDMATRTAGLTVRIDASSPPRFLRSAGGESPGPQLSAPPLLPGLFLEIEVEGRRLDNVFAVPLASVDQRNHAYIATDKDTLDIRPVGVVRVTGETAWVGEGLERGDRLVLSPLSTPVQGMALRIAGQSTASGEDAREARTAGSDKPEAPLKGVASKSASSGALEQ